MLFRLLSSSETGGNLLAGQATVHKRSSFIYTVMRKAFTHSFLFLDREDQSESLESALFHGRSESIRGGVKFFITGSRGLVADLKA